MQLYLIRHTTPDIPPGVCYGRADIGLAAGFEQEAEAVRAKLAHLEMATCFSSPATRCVRLAERLGTPTHDNRLQELDFGAWELQPWDDIPRTEIDRWSSSFVDIAPPGGECFRQLHARATDFWQELAERPPAAQTLVVTHAGVIRALLAEALGLPLHEVFRFHLDYGGVTLLDWRGTSPRVLYVNR